MMWEDLELRSKSLRKSKQNTLDLELEQKKSLYVIDDQLQSMMDLVSI